MFRARRPIAAPFKAPSSAYTTSPPSCQGLALASTSCGEKAHPATQDRSLFFCDLRVCACKLVDARPKAWHDERGADGAEPLLRPLNLTPMGPSPGMTRECAPTTSIPCPGHQQPERAGRILVPRPAAG